MNLPFPDVYLALRPADASDILSGMKFHKIWVKQCRATRGIKGRYGVKSPLDYLLGEKLLNFAEQADGHPEFAAGALNPFQYTGAPLLRDPGSLPSESEGILMNSGQGRG